MRSVVQLSRRLLPKLLTQGQRLLQTQNRACPGRFSTMQPSRTLSSSISRFIFRRDESDIGRSAKEEEDTPIEVNHTADESIIKVSDQEIIVDHAFLERKLKDQHDEADDLEKVKMTLSDWVDLENKRFSEEA